MALLANFHLGLDFLWRERERERENCGNLKFKTMEMLVEHNRKWHFSNFGDTCKFIPYLD